MIISPKYDYFLKELFHNPVVLRFFIGDVLEISQNQIHTVHLKNTFLRKRFRKQKQGILDLVVELNDNIKINIELQVKVFENWEKRQLFYLSKLYTEDIVTGENYSCLRKTIGISILDFNLSQRESYHTVYRLKDKDGYEFSDLLEIHIIELNKELTDKGEIDDWIRFFNAETEEDLKMIRTKNPGIQEAIKELKRMSMNNPLRLRYETYLKRVRDERAREMYVRNQGKAEGKAESILTLLEKRGPIPETLRSTILSERNLSKLDEWLVLASESRSVEEFLDKY